MENTVTIGKFLKASREKKKLTLDQVAAKTKININILRDLENDEIESLPNITYVRGFVKNYAKTVGLDPAEAKDLLENAYQKNETPVAEKKVQPEIKRVEKPVEDSSKGISQEEAQEFKENVISFGRSIFKKKYIVPVVVLAIVFVIIKSIVSWVGTLVNEPGKNITTESPLRDSDTNPQNVQIIPTHSDVPRDFTPEPIEEVKVKVESPEPVQKKVTAPKLAAGELPYRTFSKAPLSTFTAVADAPEAEDQNLLPASIKAAAESDKENVYIIAEGGDTWLSYKVDDDPIKRYVLRKGRRLFLKGDRVLVFIGNFKDTKIFYNNKFVEASTRSGVKSLIFPKEAAKDLVLPLFPSYKGVPYEASEYIERMKKSAD